MILKNIFIFSALVLCAMPALATSSDELVLDSPTKKLVLAGLSETSGGDAQMAQLSSLRNEARTAISGIALKWGNTACGRLVESRRTEFRNTRFLLYITPEKTEPLSNKSDPKVLVEAQTAVISGGSRQARQLEVLIDRTQFEKKRGTESHEHHYTGLLAGFMLTKSPQGDADLEVSKCVVDFLKERDQVRKSTSSSTSGGAGSVDGGVAK